MQTLLFPLPSAIQRQSTTAERPGAHPKRQKRGELADMGLVGKISLNTAWNAREVAREVTSVFSSAFGLKDGELLSYKYYLSLNTIICL